VSLRAARKHRLTLDIQYGVPAAHVPTPAQFRKWARAALTGDARVGLRVVGTPEGRRLNREYRGRDYATNVLTFVLHEKPPFAADIAMCAPVIAREAREQGKTLPAHYAHLTIHGMLHAQGYDHERRKDAAAMERLEAQIMSGLGYPDPYTTTMACEA
jgi:probable rRNA maturation factor